MESPYNINSYTNIEKNISDGGQKINIVNNVRNGNIQSFLCDNVNNNYTNNCNYNFKNKVPYNYGNYNNNSNNTFPASSKRKKTKEKFIKEDKEVIKKNINEPIKSPEKEQEKNDYYKPTSLDLMTQYYEAFLESQNKEKM